MYYSYVGFFYIVAQCDAFKVTSWSSQFQLLPYMLFIQRKLLSINMFIHGKLLSINMFIQRKKSSVLLETDHSKRSP